MQPHDELDASVIENNTEPTEKDAESATEKPVETDQKEPVEPLVPEVKLDDIKTDDNTTTTTAAPGNVTTPTSAPEPEPEGGSAGYNTISALLVAAITALLL